MSTHNIPLSIRKENQPKYQNTIMSTAMGFSLLENVLEIAVVNEPPVFEPLKCYCILCLFQFHRKFHLELHAAWDNMLEKKLY